MTVAATNGSSTATFTCTQTAANTLTISPTSVSVSYDGSSTPGIVVTSNADSITVTSDESWLQVVSPITNASSGASVSYTCFGRSDTSVDSRTAHLTFSIPGGSGTATITQAGYGPYIYFDSGSASDPNMEINAGSQAVSQSVTVHSNTT